jgi:hypothetical protein
MNTDTTNVCHMCVCVCHICVCESRVGGWKSCTCPPHTHTCLWGGNTNTNPATTHKHTHVCVSHVCVSHVCVCHMCMCVKCVRGGEKSSQQTNVRVGGCDCDCVCVCVCVCVTCVCVRAYECICTCICKCVQIHIHIQQRTHPPKKKSGHDSEALPATSTSSGPPAGRHNWGSTKKEKYLLEAFPAIF